LATWHWQQPASRREPKLHAGAIIVHW
jgi:hypothetical protein